MMNEESPRSTKATLRLPRGYPEASPKPFAAIAQGHSYDQILAGELDLPREFCGPGFILHNSSFILSQSPASDYARFTLYRCTKFVTCTGS